MEIFSARYPDDLQLIKLIDRTFLHLPSNTLEIVDVEMYMGDIFFLDYFHGLFRLDVMKSQDVRITGRYRQDACSKFAVYSNDLEN